MSFLDLDGKTPRVPSPHVPPAVVRWMRSEAARCCSHKMEPTCSGLGCEQINFYQGKPGLFLGLFTTAASPALT